MDSLVVTTRVVTTMVALAHQVVVVAVVKKRMTTRRKKVPRRAKRSRWKTTPLWTWMLQGTWKGKGKGRPRLTKVRRRRPDQHPCHLQQRRTVDVACTCFNPLPARFPCLASPASPASPACLFVLSCLIMTSLDLRVVVDSTQYLTLSIVLSVASAVHGDHFPILCCLNFVSKRREVQGVPTQRNQEKELTSKKEIKTMQRGDGSEKVTKEW